MDKLTDTILKGDYDVRLMSVIQKKTSKALAQQKHSAIDKKLKRVRKHLQGSSSIRNEMTTNTAIDQDQTTVGELNSANLRIKDEASQHQHHNSKDVVSRFDSDSSKGGGGRTSDQGGSNLLRKRTQVKREAMAKQLEDDLVNSDDEDSTIFGLGQDTAGQAFKRMKRESQADIPLPYKVNEKSAVNGADQQLQMPPYNLKLENFSEMSCDYDDARSVLSASTQCKFNPTGLFKEPA